MRIIHAKHSLNRPYLNHNQCHSCAALTCHTRTFDNRHVLFSAALYGRLLQRELPDCGRAHGVRVAVRGRLRAGHAAVHLAARHGLGRDHVRGLPLRRRAAVVAPATALALAHLGHRVERAGRRRALRRRRLAVGRALRHAALRLVAVVAVRRAQPEREDDAVPADAAQPAPPELRALPARPAHDDEDLRARLPRRVRLAPAPGYILVLVRATSCHALLSIDSHDALLARNNR